MASTNYRLASLVVVCTIALTGFGSGLRIITEPQRLNEKTTDKELKVTCLVDGPTYSSQSIMLIQITRQGQYKPMVIIDMTQQLTMGPNSRNTTEACGQIGSNSSNSYLNLTITNPGSKDVGSYKCQMVMRDENYQIIQESVTSYVTLDNRDIRDLVSNLMTTVKEHERQLASLHDVHSVQNKQIEELKNDSAIQQQQYGTLMDLTRKQNKRIQRHEQTLLEITNYEVCPKGGWEHYEADNTCLKVFGMEDSLIWSAARKACSNFRQGGDLVEIRDRDKNYFVYNLIRKSPHANPFIGVKNNAKGGIDFRYVSGQKITYNNWGVGDPNGTKDKRCVCLYSGRRERAHWYDYYCYIAQPYVCSVPAYRFS